MVQPYSPRPFRTCRRSVVVGVVDPGVGTSRRAIALAAGEIILVGPDNGLLLWAADAVGGASAAVELDEPDFLSECVGADVRRARRVRAGRGAPGLPASRWLLSDRRWWSTTSSVCLTR